MGSTARYRLDDGSLSSSRQDAVIVSAYDIRGYATAASSLIPAGFFVGVADRESGFATNEEDIDANDDGSERAMSYGLYQLRQGDLDRAGMSGDLEDPQVATQVAARVFEGYLQQIADAAGFDVHAPPEDAWRYLAWAHNAGIGQALNSIRTYGMDWAALKARPQNDYVTARLIPYADAIAGYAVPALGIGIVLFLALAWYALRTVT